MDYLFLICSFSLFVSAFAFYKIHRLWLKDAREKEELYKFEINFKTFKNWIFIIVLLIGGIVYFFKALP